MDDSPPAGTRGDPRDPQSNSDLAATIFTLLPSRATTTTTTMPTRRNTQEDDPNPTKKRKGGTSDSSNYYSHPRSSSSSTTSLNHYNAYEATYTYWISSTTTTTKSSKRGRLLQQTRRKDTETQMDLLHQSTCLNLSTTDNNNNAAESDLWILPEFDDEWEVDDAESLEQQQQQQQQQPSSSKRSNDGELLCTPLLQRAVNSNRERLRRRLEGDGWDFVGGKYAEEDGRVGQEMDMDSASKESVDEEFDVVVLPVVQVSC